MNKSIKNQYLTEFELSGLFSLSLRLVVGWTYFSAFWRRLILENKLDPELPGYIGEKFNHFLPNALGIKPLIEYLVSNPDALLWSMILFTIVEAVVGLFIMFGLMTRLMSIGVFGLAMGILLGAGWIGTTCLDEWQIGILGLAAGFTIFFTGGGRVSTDYWLSQKYPELKNNKWFQRMGSGTIQMPHKTITQIVILGSVFILLVSLFTNQVFHGGLWGKLHNKSVRPKIELSEAQITDNELTFSVYRTEGADVYGSFLIEIALFNENNNSIISLDGNDLAGFSPENIKNKYVAKIKPGEHSLIIPLGAKAEVVIKDNIFNTIPKGKYTLQLTDISGITWSAEIEI